MFFSPKMGEEFFGTAVVQQYMMHHIWVMQGTVDLIFKVIIYLKRHCPEPKFDWSRLCISVVQNLQYWSQVVAY